MTIPEAEPDLRAHRRAPTGTEADGGSTLVLEAGGARLVVSAATGGRMRSFRVDGRELLVTAGRDAIHWGCFPMAPFAGRVREGRFSFGGRDHVLPLTLPPHAIHGVAIDGPWHIDGEASMSTTLAGGWPFGGRVVQRFELRSDRLTATLELHAAEPMPGALGWHPWFRRRLDDSEEVVIALDAEMMLRREADGIAGRERIAPAPGPWDDTFTGLRRPPRIEWPGILALEVSSTCPFWVVFDEEPQGICIEPQTEPPNELNHHPHVVLPGEPLVATMTWRWWRPTHDPDQAPPGS